MSHFTKITPDLSHQPLITLDTDAFEQQLLSPLRHLLTTWFAPQTQGWFRADIIATENLGPVAGPAAIRLLWPVVDALCNLRCGEVFFNDPLDMEQRTLVTRHEALVLHMIHHMRRDDTGAARDTVALLTDGCMDPDLIRAGLSFAHRFPLGVPAGAQERPRLRVISS